MVSAVEEHGLDKAWEEMTALTNWRRDKGHFDRRRSEQARYWFEQEVRLALLASLETPEAKAAMDELAGKVAGGALVPSLAAQKMLDKLGR